MRFIIDTHYKDVWRYFWEQHLVYITEEHSFYMEDVVNKVEIELIINKISLAVCDNIIVNINGFCGLSKSMIANYQVPEYKKGCLRIEHNLKHGFAYAINNYDHEFPVYVNIQSGWVCIGNPKGKGKAVEFINKCVAVVDEDRRFVSLWLKPMKLPKI